MDYDIIRLSDAGPELASAPFETQSRLTQIAMTERPADFIADEVLPRITTAFKFSYTKGQNDDQLNIPETRASRAGALNEVEFGAQLADGSCEDHGLMTYVPHRDIREAQVQGGAWDPVAQASTGLTGLMHLDREQRAADLVFGVANYPAANSTVLQGSGQWSHEDSDPIAAILEAMDLSVTRPNTLVLGQTVWTKLRTHARIVEAVRGTGAGAAAAGIVMRRSVADLFELDRILIGAAWHQSNRRGQAAQYARLWGSHAALLHVRKPSGTRDMMPTWGFTAQAMALEVATSEEPSRGIGRGSRAVKVSECIREIVSWNSAGYLWRDAVA